MKYVSNSNWIQQLTQFKSCHRNAWSCVWSIESTSFTVYQIVIKANWLSTNNIQLEQDEKQSLNNGKVDLIRILCFINLIVFVLVCVSVCAFCL